MRWKCNCSEINPISERQCHKCGREISEYELASLLIEDDDKGNKGNDINIKKEDTANEGDIADKNIFSLNGFIGGIVAGVLILFFTYIQMSPYDLYSTSWIFFVMYFVFFGMFGALWGDKFIEGVLKIFSYF